MAADRFDALSAEIVHGSQEEFVARLTREFAQMLEQGVSNPDRLAVLARLSRDAALAVWAEYEGRVDEECAAAFEEALAAEDEAMLDALKTWAAVDAYDTGYAALRAAEAARGVAEIMRRQNVAMCDALADSWYRITAQAVAEVESGGSRRAAMERGCAALADAGLQTIDYRSGVSTAVDAALRRHVVTQWNQARNDLLMRRCDEWGVDLVFTSAHFGARPSHAAWQGKVYSRSGSSPDYPGLAEATGYGTVTGLCGANCRHTMTPYVEGYSKLPDTDWSEQERLTGMTSDEYYEATQRQRRYESAIRRTKREIATGRELGLDMADKRVLLGRQQARVRQWCAEKGLPRDYERERAYGVGRQPRALAKDPSLKYSASSLMTRSGFRKAKWRRQMEYGAVYDEKGRLVSTVFSGNGGKVTFDVPEGFEWRDRRVAHTHPGSFGGTFSSADVFHLTDGDLLSYDASCSEGTYVLERARPLTKEERRAFYDAYKAREDLSNEDRYFEVLERFMSQGMSPYGGDSEAFEREVKRAVSDDLDAWLILNAVKYGYSYTPVSGG